MHRERFAVFLVSSLVAFALAWSGAMCLVTGFGLAVENAAGLLRWSLAFAVGGSILFLLPWGGRIYTLLTAGLAGYFWQLGSPLRQLLALVQEISIRYDSAYRWGYLWFTDRSENADYPLLIVAYLVAALAARCIWRGRCCLPAVLAAVIPVAVCFVARDTVPQPPFLFLFMGAVALLVITDTVRRKNRFQGVRLVGMAAVPVLAALALLFWLVPQDGYVDRSEAVRSSILCWGQRLAGGLESALTQLTAGPQDTSGDVDLAGLGPQQPSSYPVMEVRADTAGPLYLRAWDCDVYTGIGWQRSGERGESFPAAEDALFSLQISVENPLEYRFLPYYPSQSVELSGGMASNPEGRVDYEYAMGSWAQGADALTSDDRARYLALPAHTREEVRHILEQLAIGEQPEEMAQSIGAYVRSSAGYDLEPERMPKDRKDFALWFLKEADRGYCVHFATAAVVLLRGAGIPARYVTGYLVQTKAGQSVTVTGREAHAWAEYYDTQLACWRLLEATPPDPESASGNVGAPVPETVSQTDGSTSGSQPDAADADETLPAPKPEPEEAEGRRLGSLGWVFGAVGAASVIIECQRILRLWLRRCCQRRGSFRRRGLALWREAMLLCRLLGMEPGEDLREIAQKAKFSHREPEAEELEYMESYLALCRRHLRQQPLRIRLIHRYLLAAY